MSISIVQTFNPPLRLYTGVEKVSVKSREWQMGENLIVSDGIQIMGYMDSVKLKRCGSDTVKTAIFMSVTMVMWPRLPMMKQKAFSERKH